MFSFEQTHFLLVYLAQISMIIIQRPMRDTSLVKLFKNPCSSN